MDQAAGLRKMVNIETALPSETTDKEGARAPQLRVISVTSGKGGVGKTSITANLAVAFQKLNKRVLILDADLGLANMDIMLGINPRYTIGNVLTGEKSLEDVIVSTPAGFKLLPAASGIQELTELDEDQKRFLLNELDAINDEFDIILIDTSAGISSNVMYFNFAAMERLVVLTNEPTSLTDAYALIKVLTGKYNQKRFKILINLVQDAGEADRIFRSLSIAVDKYLQSPSLDYIGWIPYDKMIPKAIRRQKLLIDTHPGSPAGKSIMALAERLAYKEEDLNFEGDIKFFWRRLLNC
ncbi:MAG: MinD/ParA family protein [Deltaproteobacteria bacterium]|jgi:flagellar biosynthesis protein FlhG|nr:MinD/ParA family protein [Deltaproteobacteria bacterium]